MIFVILEFLLSISMIHYYAVLFFVFSFLIIFHCCRHHFTLRILCIDVWLNSNLPSVNYPPTHIVIVKLDDTQFIVFPQLIGKKRIIQHNVLLCVNE